VTGGPRILVVGDIVTDILAVQTGPLAVDSDTPAAITVTGGGSAANTAAWLAASGTAVDLLGVVGNDAAGSDRLAELAATGVGCGLVRVSPAYATGSVIVLAYGQDRTMLCDRGANHDLQLSDVDSAFAALPDLTHVHLSGYTLLDDSSRPAGLRVLATATSLGLSASVDAASAAPLRRVGGQTFLGWIHGVDVLFANLDEAEVLIGSTVDSLPDMAVLAGTVGAAAVKLGDRGAVWVTAETVFPVPASTATVVDTTGAGDAFAAGLLTAMLGGADLSTALSAAVNLGARAVATAGGRPPVSPDR
jgi:sugar/nucleoside kinase (ribokinase family)